MNQNDVQQVEKQDFSSIDAKTSNYIQQKSSRYAQYLDEMKCISNQTLPRMDINKPEKIAKLDYIFFNRNSFIRQVFEYCRIDIFVRNSTINKEYLLLDIKYNNFVISDVAIIIKDDVSPFHQNCISSSGNFANVYKAKIFNQSLAIKCFKINQERSISQQFFKLIKQFCLYKMAELVQAGPKLKSANNFSIMIYRNCMEFTMELCQQVINYKPEMEKDLKTALARLHNSKIIHFDIKPENICYSPSFKKFVFIDFGLSEVIRSQFGETLMLSYRGSLAYCSPQMKACSRVAMGQIDPFYNDLHCLNQSIAVLKQSCLVKHQEQELLEMRSNFQYFKFICMLLNLQVKQTFLSRIQHHCDYVETYEQCEGLIRIIKQFQMNFELRGLLSYFQLKQINLAKNHTKQSLHYVYKAKRYGQIQDDSANQNVLNIFQEIFKDSLQYLWEIRHDNILISTDIQSISFRKQQKIAYIEKTVHLLGKQISKMSRQQIFSEYYTQILEIIRQNPGQVNKSIQFSHFLPSFLLFEIVNQYQIFEYFQLTLRLLKANKGNQEGQQIAIFIIFKFLMSIQWIRCTVSYRYAYKYLSVNFFHLIQSLLQKHSPAQKYRSTHYTFLFFYCDVMKVQKPNQYCFLLSYFDQFVTERHLHNQQKQISQFLWSHVLNKVPFVYLQQYKVQSRILHIISQNKQNNNFKLYPYYFNVINFLCSFNNSVFTWIIQKFRISFSDFTFYQQFYIYYFDKQKILDFPSLGSRINKNSKIILQQNRIDYLQLIIRTFLSQKYNIFISNQRKLNEFIFSIGERALICQRFLQQINYTALKKSTIWHKEYTSQIKGLFRYQLAHSILDIKAVSVKVFDCQKNNGHSHENDKKDLGQIMRQREISLRIIKSVIQNWYKFLTPQCLSCKIVNNAYLQLLYTLKILLQGNIKKSFYKFINLFLNIAKVPGQSEFLNQALGIYFYYYFLRDPTPHIPKIQIIDFAIESRQISSLNFSHIILNSQELYYQIFKRNLIRRPSQTIQRLIMPTICDLKFAYDVHKINKLHRIFVSSWVRLLHQISSQAYSNVIHYHLNFQLYETIRRFMKKQLIKDVELLEYVLSIMKIFCVQLQKCRYIYQYVSICLKIQSGGPNKKFHLSKFYQYLRIQKSTNRYYVFKERMIWKLGQYQQPNQICQFIKDIITSMQKKKKRIKSFYQKIIEKAIRYQKINKQN